MRSAFCVAQGIVAWSWYPRWIFSAGDILSIYALVSFVLILTRKWSDRKVLILMFLLLLQPVEVIRTIYSYFLPGIRFCLLCLVTIWDQLAR
jgi:hypothetical protein